MDKENFTNPIHFGNQEYIQKLAEEYRRDPSSIEPEWRGFFQGIDFATFDEKRPLAANDSSTTLPDALRVKQLIDAYRKYGHLVSQTNPMVDPVQEPQELSLSYLGFHKEELAKSFPTCKIAVEPTLPLEEIIQRLRQIYCQTISYEIDSIDSLPIREWIHERILHLNQNFDPDTLRHLLQNLYKAKEFELFLQRKFLGAKRFSLEGGETFLPLMDELINQAASQGYQSCIIGMAHRGRLNTMCNLLKKPYALLFHEFGSSALPAENEGLGDVKYHKGYSQELTCHSHHRILVTLASNPSHLESIDPVVMGMTLAKQKQSGGVDSVLPVLVHGDASIAGQGVVYETMQFMNLRGYAIGGAIHIVINNQIGFTATPEESRSTRYCTDIAKGFGCPVIHVNAEDPVSCLRAAILAFEIRHQFHIDVFIDLNCHRLFGHNEADEPSFTNPVLYKKIKEKDHIYKVFSQKMIESGVVGQEDVQEMEKKFQNELNSALDEAMKLSTQDKIKKEICQRLSQAANEVSFEQVETHISRQTYLELVDRFTHIPEEFTAHLKLRKMFDQRKKELKNQEDGAVIDWASGELLAYASLLKEGVHIRLSGEDSKRGTFSHRHATIVDQEQNHLYTPLEHISETQASFEVYNSPLSEYAVMGFDYGYALYYPNSLVIWEGQFGDFVNGAQIIIDQYLASAETKWGKASPLTLFLPHGFEGMGPEHSSCRFERFLKLAALDNMRIVFPSTPAQIFHLLRRQAKAEKKKPLVVIMPKSMLRLAASYSKPSDLTQGEFCHFLTDVKGPRSVRKLILSSGKIYYEMAERRAELMADDIALVRIEQLYPFHADKFQEIIAPFKGAEQVCFVQEEPSNQGSWEYLRPILQSFFTQKIEYIGRARSSTPDTGFVTIYKIQQEEILRQAIGEKHS